MVVSTKADLDLLAELNKQLIEDEQHDNPMNVEQLRCRMEDFLRTDYQAYLFMESNTVRGYALVNHARDPLYLRQFYVCRDSRRRGVGSTAFDLLLRQLGTDRIDIEVMSWNERGQAFWRSLRFTDRSIYMRREGRGDGTDGGQDR